MKCLKVCAYFPVNPSVQISLQGRVLLSAFYQLLSIEWGYELLLKMFLYGLRNLEPYQIKSSQVNFYLNSHRILIQFVALKYKNKRL